jgi:hypothetical protein
VLAFVFVVLLDAVAQEELEQYGQVTPHVLAAETQM